MQHIDYEAWLCSVVAEYRERGDNLRVRPHPDITKKVRPLAEDLEGARLVAAYNSTALVESQIEGLPTRSFGPSMATLADGVDRQQWAHNLAYCQWNLDEMRAGETWSHLFR